MSGRRARVLLVRGHHVSPWGLRPWEDLLERFDVRFLLPRRNLFDVGATRVPPAPVRALRDVLPGGRIGEVVAGVAGERYLGAEAEFAAADIVHTEELSFWFSAESARLKARYGYTLVVTVWETLPLLGAFRNRHARVYRRQTLPAADLFLAVTERARDALLVEGVEADRIEVCEPGIDLARFAAAQPDEPPDAHLIVSPARLVWEKGHQDVLRAVAALHRGLIPATVAPRLLVVGSGPEESRLRAHAAELGVGAAVEFRSVPYEQMPSLYARASCMVLASLPSAGCGLFLGDVPRCFWEEQFGMVLAEAMAAGLPIIASRSGAIPEVAGDSASYFDPGDWMALAHLLATGPLARPPGTRVDHPATRVQRYSTAAAAARLADVYDRLLSARR